MNKTFLFFLLITFFLSSCNNDDSVESELIGTWKLVEISVDPGDGSGVFETVISEKLIEFHKDGVVTSNGIITTASIESTTQSSLRYSETESVIFSEGFSSMKFEIIDSFLIIDNLCVETCQSKYIKIQ